MPAVATGPMIRREIGDDHVCLLVFDRPESGANIFDAATLDELNDHLASVENDASLRGLIIASAKKSIFVAGADLKTLLQQAQSDDMRAFIAHGQRVLNRLAGLQTGNFIRRRKPGSSAWSMGLLHARNFSSWLGRSWATENANWKGKVPRARRHPPSRSYGVTSRRSALQNSEEMPHRNVPGKSS